MPERRALIFIMYFQNDGRQSALLPQFVAKTDWREAEQRRSMRVQDQLLTLRVNCERSEAISSRSFNRGSRRRSPPPRAT
jgi:hypothetical protein